MYHLCAKGCLDSILIQFFFFLNIKFSRNCLKFEFLKYSANLEIDRLTAYAMKTLWQLRERILLNFGAVVTHYIHDNWQGRKTRARKMKISLQDCYVFPFKWQDFPPNNRISWSPGGLVKYLVFHPDNWIMVVINL